MLPAEPAGHRDAGIDILHDAAVVIAQLRQCTSARCHHGPGALIHRLSAAADSNTLLVARQHTRTSAY